MKQERKMDRFWWFLGSQGGSFTNPTGTILMDQLLPFRPGSLGRVEGESFIVAERHSGACLFGWNWRCLLKTHQSCGRSKTTRSGRTAMEWTRKLKISSIFSGLYDWYGNYFLSRSIFAYPLTLKTENKCCALCGSVISILSNNSNSYKTNVPIS